MHVLVQCVVPLESWFATCCAQVTGDSIFNLLALADAETDKDDRPVYPQKILSVEVPFSLLSYLIVIYILVLPVFCLGDSLPNSFLSASVNTIYPYVSFFCFYRFSGTHLRILFQGNLRSLSLLPRLVLR